ncbi:hypothetical protein [Pseudomonas sp. VE 196-7]|uniref:hypothetical protein n=1 Tax=unclassified Pseudomonas TaxID=196821 RepID=UPI0021D49329|nr:hypothetical protein [Pseudomonas sp. VE 196-7]MCU7218365.1 hypothetical protein [Pseudomonas sp. VE 196-7]
MGIPAKRSSKAQDGLRGFCGAVDDILMTGQGRFSEGLAVMTLSLSGVYPAPNTSRVLKVFAASLGSFFLPEIRHVSPKPTPNPVGAAAGCDLLILVFINKSKIKRSQPAAAPTRLCQQVCGVYLQFGARLV